MADLKYNPVPHNHAEFLAPARTRQGFAEKYDSLELEYALAGQMLKKYAAAVGCDLQVKLVPHKAA